jgi:XTP/dITP diphosphohydrolase
VRVVLATANAHKLRELEALVPAWKLERPARAVEAEETGETYRDNARAKALAARTGVPPDTWVLGDDSGLEVDGLGGRPGVRSARYAGPGEDAVDKLLGELAGVAGDARRARYVCELVLLPPSGGELTARGTLEGRIAEERRGSEGFGYDPVFVPEGETRTVAELGNEWKRTSSHRARATAALAERVVAYET